MKKEVSFKLEEDYNFLKKICFDAYFRLSKYFNSPAGFE